MAIYTNLLNATEAYRRATDQLRLDQATGTRADPVKDFSEVLQGSIEKAIDIQKTGEEMAMLGVANKADLTDVVTAVSSAELTLETVVAVRDRVIAAYQDIIRMPI